MREEHVPYTSGSDGRRHPAARYGVQLEEEAPAGHPDRGHPPGTQAQKEPLHRQRTPLPPHGNEGSAAIPRGGEASLYEGGNSIGALGERLRYGTKYAAHRTLPLPCTVRVTSISTGKSCLVRVNDRGPFHRRRIIDISPAVAREIGFHQWGVHQVEVEVVSVGDGPNQRTKE